MPALHVNRCLFLKERDDKRTLHPVPCASDLTKEVPLAYQNSRERLIDLYRFTGVVPPTQVQPTSGV